MFITGVFLTAVGGIIWLPTIISKVNIKQLPEEIRWHKNKILKNNHRPNKDYSTAILNLPRKDRKEVMKTIELLKRIRENLENKGMNTNQDNGYLNKLLNVFGGYTDFDLWGREEGIISTIISCLKEQPDLIIKLDRFQDLLLAYQDAFKQFYELHPNNPLASLDDLLDDYTNLYELITKLHIEILKEVYHLQEENKYQASIDVKLIQQRVKKIVGKGKDNGV